MPVLAGLPAPKTKSVPSGPTAGARAPRAKRAGPPHGSDSTLDPDLPSGLGLPQPLCSLTIVIDPGRLQELHCSAAAAAGLRREPRSSVRRGH